MSTPKGKRNLSKDEFDALYYQVHNDAEDMIEHNFRAKPKIAQQNDSYIQTAGTKLRGFVWDLIDKMF